MNDPFANNQYNDYRVSFDELLKDQGTARDTPPSHGEPPPSGPKGYYAPEDLPPGFDPDAPYDTLEGSQAMEQVSEEMLRVQARTATRLVDGILGKVLQAYGKQPHDQKYRASAQERSDLEEAWVPVMRMYGVKIDPRINLLLVYITVYLPKVLEARVDRQLELIKEEQANLRARMDQMENQMGAKPPAA